MRLRYRPVILFLSFLLILPHLFSQARQTKMTQRVMKADEFDRFQSSVGSFEEGENYNVIIDGHGTGLKPPDESQWQKIKQMPVLGQIELSHDLPPAFDNSETNWFPPIGSQGMQGSCVAWACAYYTKTFQEALEHGWDLSGCTYDEESGPDLPYRDYIFTPAFVYNQINAGVDGGSYYSDAMNLLYDVGCCTWGKLPYNESNYTKWANEGGWRQAPLYRSLNGFSVMDVSTVQGMESLKQLISDGNLAIISVAADYYGVLTVNDLWTVDNYLATETNHANTVVGYDDSFGPYTESGNPDTYGAFKVANSWGEGGWETVKDGFLYISYACMKQMIEYVYFYQNAEAYLPQMISVFYLNHLSRGDCQIHFGLGPTESPIIAKGFSNYLFGGGSHAYPANHMVVDITEFIPHMTELGDILFMSVYDRDFFEGYSIITGSIIDFSVEIYDDYLSGIPIASIESEDDFPIETINSLTVYSLIMDQRIIEVSSTDTLVTWRSGDYTFDVQCYALHSLDWEASILSGREWISFVSDSSDSISGNFTVHCEENTDLLNDRMGIIQIQSSKADNTPIDVTITQSKATYLLNIDPLQADVSYMDGDINFAITVDGPDTLTWSSSIVGGESWLHIVSGSTGQGDGTLVIHHDVNIDPYNARQDTLHIECEKAANTPIDLIVAQSEAVYTVAVTPENISIPWQSGDSTLQVTAAGPVSLDWSTSIPEGSPWLNITSGENGNGNGLVSISFDANMDPDHDRVAHLQIHFGDPLNDVLDVSVNQYRWEEFDRIVTGSIVEEEMLSQGVSWGDYDGDGDLDIFVTHGSDIMQRNNILYDNRTGGLFTRITMQQGSSFGSSWGDYDNDGDLDLFVANTGDNYLYRNKGNKEFEMVKDIIVVQDGGSSRGCSWGDFDSDGLLDLFVANCNNQENFLYQNLGNGYFKKVVSGAIVNDVGDSRACAWADYDNDGYLDLFVANYGNQNNCLYHNEGDRTFTKVTIGDIVNNGGKSQGCSWGDYNNDGYLDLYVTNRPDQNNFLYRNNGDGSFSRITTGDIVTDKGSSFGSSWGDYNNDGNLDLIVTNHPDQDNFLYRNNGDDTFQKILEKEVVEGGGNSYGVGWGDYDHDGDVDLYMANYDQSNFLYSNNAYQHHWIDIQCIGTVSNSSAIGTGIHIKSHIFGKSVWQTRQVSGQTGYLSQNSLNVEFGLGDAAVIDSIVIFWPSGIYWDSTNISVNQFVVIREWAHRPVATPDQAVTLVTNPVMIAVLANDTDEDGDVLRIQSIDTTKTIGAVAVNPGDTTITYTPDPIYIGTDRLSYIVSDGLCGRDTGEVTIEINPIPNSPPHASDDSVSTMEGTPIVIDVLENDSDPDQDTLSILSIDTAATHGHVTIRSGDTSLTYVPAFEYVGLDFFNYVISDGRGGLDTAEVLIHVLEEPEPEPEPLPNNAPVAKDDSASTFEGVTIVLSVLENDADDDGDRLTIQALDTTSTFGSVSIQSGDTTIAYSAPIGFGGSDRFRYVVGDGQGGLDTANVTVQVSILSGLSNRQPKPKTYHLSQNFPNPFNPETEVSYQIPKTSSVRIVVYSIMGQEVRILVQQRQSAGYYSAVWDGRNSLGFQVPSGIYFLYMEAGAYLHIRKMTLLR